MTKLTPQEETARALARIESECDHIESLIEGWGYEDIFDSTKDIRKEVAVLRKGFDRREKEEASQ